ncbi:hypothetical protein INT44_002787 [Umbelopsis vinacea]|uniref:NodB homology domain-containing protein n=1 Tax=Umbelopsis vinacea TaxID=44442 RepID=A0A8H7UNS6_9FUNG|nr:hypothetical protein INT44_002787 [Umbelopsis vinacea]KAI9290237.1 hypothetical protein BC943DRAFT_313564 [Umbelopsis sp. AD052]
MKSLATSLAVAAAFLSSFVLAQDGTPTIVQGGSNPYTCDPTKCIAPKCMCASQSPPGGIKPADAPQFVTITFDDSVQPELLQTAYDLLNVQNPNGCKAKGSWYVSMMYTDFSLVQSWFAQGNEVADHTFTHVGTPSAQEIQAAADMLNAYAGVPHGMLKGFRAPFLNYTADTIKEIAAQGFLYDTSATAVVDDCYWPYTLDNGLANDCWTGICNPGTLNLPGVWEVPMYAVLDNASIPQLMDVYLAGSPADVTTWSQTNFDRHYNGNRQPFGIYVHPTHLTNYAGLPDATALKSGVVSFIQSLASKPDVWFVTNDQLLQWMQNPVPASQLASQSYMQCQKPVTPKEICNGLEALNYNSTVVTGNLINACNFNTSNFATCFNCPGSAPSLQTPVPASGIANGTSGYRTPLPSNCNPLWWDPVAGQCLCTTSSCAYQDTSVPKQQNSTNSSTSGSASPSASGKAASSAAPGPLAATALTMVAALLTTFIL